uniref:Transthyretin-like family protein n=1 Tax=Heterorhabditis bacteriophora TaxID=37862 RepID=A0A1I7X6Q8_HETBA
MLAYFVLFSLFPSVLTFRQQMVGVRGRLTCGNLPLPNTTVKLWDNNMIGTDKQLADTKTDQNGNFELSGGLGSIFGMDVHFKIYHDCEDGIVPCQRKVDLRVPSSYVSRSSRVEKWFEAGTMNMAFKYPNEERSCIN